MKLPTVKRLQPTIGVIGGNQCGSKVAHQAEEVGRLIAQRGGIVVCGGLGGVMEAVSRGASEAGGLCIGILPGGHSKEANPYIHIAIPTDMGHARNVIIARTADALIAIDGKFGTLSEVAFALILEKPVISLGSWEVDPKVLKAKNAKEAADLVFQAIGR
ncbi:MAG TPA: TIGR00725 family protein [Nitrospiria bacterium]|jgi:uncharacterized protein (TIGR00725 family)|nr:TIGR00725 family protein [Nitrospiria bacterium]